jgi:hypothetical protein
MMQILDANYIKMKKKINTKAQLRIQEMAFMLVGVFLFFGLVGLIVMGVVYSSLYNEANKLAEQKTFGAMVALADSPEFSCVSSKSNCIDGDKAISLKNKSAYIKFWPFSSLRIITRHSAFSLSYSDMIECTKANYPDCDVITIYDKEVAGEIASSNFVAFCRKEYQDFGNLQGRSYDNCEIGMIVAGTEYKNSPLS